MSFLQITKLPKGTTKSMKKVLQFIHGLNMGGAETLVKEYCLKLDKASFEVVVLCFDRLGSPYEKLFEKAGIRVIYISDYLKEAKGTAEKIVRRIKLYLYVRKIIREENPDIIHFHLPINTYVKFAYPKKSVKLFHTVHSEPKAYWNNKSIESKCDFAAAKYLVKHYKMRFIVLHDEMSKEVNEMFSTDDSVILNNGVDFTRFENVKSSVQIRKEEGIPQNAFVIGHIGRFIEVKNHKFLVEIFSELKKKNENSFLLLVGAGPLKAETEALIAEKGLTDSVRILSDRTDIPDLLNAMDIFVMPSLYEGLTVAAIEAQISGRKCVFSDTVSKSTIISNLVKQMSLSEPAEEWAEFINNFSVECVEYYNKDEWDMNNVVRRLEDIYCGK